MTGRAPPSNTLDVRDCSKSSKQKVTRVFKLSSEIICNWHIILPNPLSAIARVRHSCSFLSCRSEYQLLKHNYASRFRAKLYLYRHSMQAHLIAGSFQLSGTVVPDSGHNSTLSLIDDSHASIF